MRFIYIILLVFISLSLKAQTTVGLKYNTPEAYNGYTLFNPYFSDQVYLINNCGEIVHQWDCDDNPYYTGYLMENGNLVRYGGSGNSNALYIEMRDWDNNVLWKWFPGQNYEYIHSDLAILPNGNFILIQEERFSATEWINMGGNPANLSGSYHALESLIEVQPSGATGANVVWEWRIKDHLIQDFDPTKSNYGVVGDEPGKWDINNPNWVFQSADKMHFNGIDYHPGKDQVVISCWSCSEAFIIDHSTTTFEASGSSGGQYGKGGDFLFRYGNPINYDAGTTADRVFYGQHNADWISDNLPNGGKLSVFENGNGRPGGSYTRVVIFEPVEDAAGNYIMSNGTYLPTSFDYEWSGNVDGNLFYSQYMGGVNMQPNGNLTVCEATSGRFFEIQPSTGNVVWSYQNPDRGIIVNQGNAPGSVWTYRAEKYPPEYPAFTGKDLTPIGIVEDFNNETNNCTIYQNTDCSNVTASINSIPAVTTSINPISLSATPSGGMFSGNGVIFSAFNPTIAGPGLHVITYTYDDGNGCTATDQINILVGSISYNFVNYNLGTINPE